jgi:hypothetical protein
MRNRELNNRLAGAGRPGAPSYEASEELDLERREVSLNCLVQIAPESTESEQL